ncbi:unnamed protein product, partial [Sphagnum troendelagicum]
KLKGAMVRNLQQKITLAEVQLQRDPEDEPIREILSVAQGHLADTLQEKVARNHQLSSASWFSLERSHTRAASKPRAPTSSPSPWRGTN